MTGCFDCHMPSKQKEDFFIASKDASHRLVATMARYDRNCPLCVVWLHIRFTIFFRQTAWPHCTNESLASLVIFFGGIQAALLLENLRPI